MRPETISIPSQPSAGLLRQQIASRLQVLGSSEVTRARFTIFSDINSGDLSSLPPAFRGSISGAGSVTVEISITKEKVGTKADAERLAESLPNVPGATYNARLDVLIPDSLEREVDGA